MAPLVPILEGAAQISRKRNRSAVIFGFRQGTISTEHRWGDKLSLWASRVNIFAKLLRILGDQGELIFHHLKQFAFDIGR